MALGLVQCLAFGWCFGAPRRAAGLFASHVLVRPLQTAGGDARRSRLAGGENPWRGNNSQLRDTTLEGAAAPTGHRERRHSPDNHSTRFPSRGFACRNGEKVRREWRSPVMG